MSPRRLKNSTTSIASTKPSSNNDLPRRPRAKDDTTMLADSHCAKVSSVEYWSLDMVPTTYHGGHVQVRMLVVGALALGHSFNTSLLHIESTSEAMELSNDSIALRKGLSPYCTSLLFDKRRVVFNVNSAHAGLNGILLEISFIDVHDQCTRESRSLQLAPAVNARN